MKSKKRIVSMDKPTTIEVQPNEMAVLIQPDGSVTHYIPGGNQEEIPVPPGIMVGMASTMKVFSAQIEILMEVVAQMEPEDDEESSS